MQSDQDFFLPFITTKWMLLFKVLWFNWIWHWYCPASSNWTLYMLLTGKVLLALIAMGNLIVLSSVNFQVMTAEMPGTTPSLTLSGYERVTLLFTAAYSSCRDEGFWKPDFTVEENNSVYCLVLISIFLTTTLGEDILFFHPRPLERCHSCYDKKWQH